MSLVNGYGESVCLDANTYYVHQGLVRGFYNEDTDLDTGESLDTLIVTGSKSIKAIFDLQAFGGQLIAYIYEGAITSDDGTELRTSRFNRMVNIPASYKVYSAPSVVSVGDQFVKRRVLAHAQGNSGITSAVTSGIERVLKPYTKYLLRQTAVSDNITLTLVGMIIDCEC